MHVSDRTPLSIREEVSECSHLPRALRLFGVSRERLFIELVFKTKAAEKSSLQPISLKGH